MYSDLSQVTQSGQGCWGPRTLVGGWSKWQQMKQLEGLCVRVCACMGMQRVRVCMGVHVHLLLMCVCMHAGAWGGWGWVRGSHTVAGDVAGTSIGTKYGAPRTQCGSAHYPAGPVETQ